MPRSAPRHGWLGRAAHAISVSALLLVSASGWAEPVAGAGDIVLTVTAGGNGAGTVTSQDGYINCRRAGGHTTGTCSHAYPDTGSPVQAKLYWYADLGSLACPDGMACATKQIRYLSLPASATFGATFELEIFDLKVAVVGSGHVVVSDGSSSVTICRAPDGCSLIRQYGDHVTLTAKTDPGWAWSKWSRACQGSSTVCRLTITATTAVTATFKAIPATPTPTGAPPTAEPTPLLSAAAIVTAAPASPTPTSPAPTDTTAPVPSATAPPPLAPAADSSPIEPWRLVVGAGLLLVAAGLGAGGLLWWRRRFG